MAKGERKTDKMVCVKAPLFNMNVKIRYIITNNLSTQSEIYALECEINGAVRK